MDFQRFARPAFNGLSRATTAATTTTATTMTPLARILGSSSSSPFAALQRQCLSTTASCLAPPPRSPSWPPERQRTTASSSSATSSASSSASSSVTSSASSSPAKPTTASSSPNSSGVIPSTTPATSAPNANALKDRYTSENPAHWAMWSSEDFHKRHGDSGLGGSGSGRVDGEMPVLLRPITGRTVHVTGRIDQARAFTGLDIICLRNRMAATDRRQKFHERPGLKRKRLHSQRWRRRFRAAMMTTVDRVQTLSKQGW